MIKSWCDGTWRIYTLVLDRADYSFDSKVGPDYGCQYGLILPMFLDVSAAVVIGLDAEEVNVESGSRFFSSR